MFQFLKHTGALFGEKRAAVKLGIPIKAMGDGFTWRSKDMDRTQELAREQWENCKKAILSDEHDVIILDEFTYPLHYGWIPVEDAIDNAQRRNPTCSTSSSPEGMPQMSLSSSQT